MKNLSSAQLEAYEKLSFFESKTACDIGVKMSTLDALCRKGVCKEVTTSWLGFLFSPRTTRKFILRPGEGNVSK